MKKKILIFGVLVLILMFGTLTAFAETVAQGTCGADLTWTLDDEGTLTISGTGAMTDWYDFSDVPWFNNAKIKSVIIEDGVTNIGYSAFMGCYNITNITIPDSVTSIGSYAFFACQSLTSITIPDSVTSIATIQFSYCDSLTSITVDENNPNYSSVDGILFDKDKTTLVQFPRAKAGEYIIPDSVAIIGDYAFSECDSLTSIIIPDNVTSIGDGAFTDCNSLTSVTIDMGVTKINDYAFQGCTSITDVYYNGTEEDWNNIAIGEYNEPLTNATIHYSDTIKTIIANGICGENLTWTLDEDGLLTISGTGDMTNWLSNSDAPWYNHSDSIKSIIIENGVTSIGDRAFSYCDSLTSIAVDENNLNYSSEDGVLFNKNKTTLIWCPGIKTGEYIIPDSVTNISDCAFYNCNSLTSVIIPVSVTTIGWQAFYDCDSLTSVTIPVSVTKIGSSAFSNCDSLTSITVDGNNPEYSSKDGVLFNKDKTILICCPGGKTEEYIIPDSVTSIGGHAFAFCKNLASVVIPDSVTSIVDYAFYWCDSLTNITIPDGVTRIGEGTFFACDKLTSITIPDRVTSIGNMAFFSCGGLTSITIGNGVTNIGNETFLGCDSLTDVYYTGTEEEWNKISIGSDNACLINATMHYNYVIKEIIAQGTCGDNLTWTLDEEGTLTISGTGEMTNWSASSDVPWHENGPEIKSVIIENGVTTIGDHAFDYCYNLTSATIPESITIIGDYAFANCYKLASVTIPDNVTSIGNYAFYDCDTLTSIIIPDSVTSIGISAFSSSGALKDATIGNSVTSIGDKAFYSCGGLTSIIIPDSVTSIGERTFYSCRNLKSITIGNGITSIGDRAFYSCTSLTDVYYNGSEADWDDISIGSDNTALTNATIHSHEGYTNTLLFSGGKTFIVAPENIKNGRTVILALYNGNVLSEVQSATYLGEELTFIASKPYTEAKVMVWSDLGSLKPICEFEQVK